MNEPIEAAGHELWLPIPLDGEPEAFHEELVRRFGDADENADHAALLVGVARQLRDANAGAERTGTQNLAGWALLERAGTLAVRALATLRVVLLEPDITATEVVEALSGAETLFETPLSRQMDTLSGEAVNVRLRPMVEQEGGSRVHEVAAILWPRPQQEAWYILSTYSTDLVEAAEIGGLLEELAAGIEGL